MRMSCSGLAWLAGPPGMGPTLGELGQHRRVEVPACDAAARAGAASLFDRLRGCDSRCGRFRIRAAWPPGTEPCAPSRRQSSYIRDARIVRWHVPARPGSVSSDDDQRRLRHRQGGTPVRAGRSLTGLVSDGSPCSSSSLRTRGSAGAGTLNSHPPRRRAVGTPGRSCSPESRAARFAKPWIRSGDLRVVDGCLRKSAFDTGEGSRDPPAEILVRRRAMRSSPSLDLGTDLPSSAEARSDP